MILMYSSYCFSPRRSKSDLGLCPSRFCAMTALCGAAGSAHVRAVRGRDSSLDKAESLFLPGARQSSVSSPAEPAWDLGQPSQSSGCPRRCFGLLQQAERCSLVFWGRIFLCFPWKKKCLPIGTLLIQVCQTDFSPPE